MSPEPQVDLTPFLNENAQIKAGQKAVDWSERLNLIRAFIPTGAFDVDLSDTETFARIVRDVLKVQQHASRPEAERSSAGRRPRVAVESGMAGWRELMGQSFSELPFRGAFRVLASDRSDGKPHSLTMIARKTNISRSRVHRLLGGQETPTPRDLEMIAAGYGRKPSYFHEYRVAVIVGYMVQRMDSDPAISTSLYEVVAK